jgi:enamine deaminase RidA (YjgF/YER057c/UK114 family)
VSVVEDRLGALGLSLPPVSRPVAAYVPALRTGSYVYVSGQVPFVDGTLAAKGKVGAEITAEHAQELARICALNAIAAVRSVVDLDDVVRVVKVVGFVASDPSFTGQPGVVNGASELLGAAFGEAGAHARSAVGVAVLPLDAPVEVELVVEVR